MSRSVGRLGRVTGYVSYLLLVALLGIEGIVRLVPGLDRPPGSRPFQPFFLSGDYYLGYHSLGETGDSPEGPLPYGYEHDVAYFYQPREHAADALDRTDFLFGHSLARYDPAFVRSASPDQVRIFVLGGSAAQGSGATGEDRTWFSLLEARLRSDFANDRIFVFNAAMGSFVSAQERLALDLAVLPRRADIVIDLNGFNDVYNPLAAGARPGDPYMTGSFYLHLYGSPLVHLLRNESAAFRLFHRRLASSRIQRNALDITRDPETAELLARGIVDVYLANSNWILRRCRVEGIGCLVFLQPFQDLTRHAQGSDAENPLFAFQLDVYSRIRAAIGDDETARLIDLSGVFDGHGALADVYQDMVHPSDLGQRILAAAIHRRVAPLVEQALADRGTPATRRPAGPQPRGSVAIP